MPAHRARGQHQPNFEALVHDLRLNETLPKSSFDLASMAYRYRFLFLREKAKFLGSKNLRPALVEDLWNLAFAALMSRDQQAPAVLVSEAVEAVKISLGATPVSLSNAFLRGISRQLKTLREEVQNQPELLVPPELRKRWQDLPNIIIQMGQDLSRRPQGDDLSAPFPWVTHLMESLRFKTKNPRILHQSATQGRSLLHFSELLHRQGLAPKFVVTESKYKRWIKTEETLKKSLPEIQLESHLWAWGEQKNLSIPTEQMPFSLDFDLAFIELPSTNCIYLSAYPDLIVGDFSKKLSELLRLQRAILGDLNHRLKPGTPLALSLASFDPEEVGQVSAIIGSPPLKIDLPKGSSLLPSVWFCKSGF